MTANQAAMRATVAAATREEAAGWAKAAAKTAAYTATAVVSRATAATAMEKEAVGRRAKAAA